MTPKFPNVTAKLTDINGNVFDIIGIVARALKDVNERDAANDFTREAINADSYDAVLRLCMQYVDVE